MLYDRPGTGKDLFGIDLSRVLSKYIGETEKNLSRLFDKADALFGKWTEIRDAHDKSPCRPEEHLLLWQKTFPPNSSSLRSCAA